MNILEMLKTKPHSTIYLQRYFNFVMYCDSKNRQQQNLEYTEKHHILPKAGDMFPEYHSLKQHPWNCAILTFRQHFLAHYMLMKAFGTESQIVSFIITSGQQHVKDKKLNSKLVEIAKIKLSAVRKGVFTRGYDENGIPLVSESTKQKLSKQKKLFYTIDENRKAQSNACSGKKKANTTKMKHAANNRSIEHSKNLTESIRATWKEKKQNGDTKRVKDGLYITPIGIFTSIPDYRSYCRNSDKAFSIHAVKKNPKLNSSVIGMTPKELGFFFVHKDDTRFSQYCVDLNQAHLPEPNHPLSSELNDFLLRERLLLQT